MKNSTHITITGTANDCPKSVSHELATSASTTAPTTHYSTVLTTTTTAAPTSTSASKPSVIAFLSDKNLLALCRKYGTQTILWRQKFIGLLPEVARRKLYERKGFSSIFEFAGKLAGISREHVNRVINLDDRFREKNTLRNMLINGQVSANKLTKVASIADIVSEEDIVEVVKNMSCRSVETYVRDVKHVLEVREIPYENEVTPAHFDIVNNNEIVSGRSCNVKIRNGFLEPQSDLRSVHVNMVLGSANSCVSEGIENQKIDEIGSKKAKLNISKKEKLNIDEDTLAELLALQKKGIDINALLREFLQNRRDAIEENKSRVAEKEHVKAEKRHMEGKESTRYVSRETKKIITQEYGDKCAIDWCGKKSEHLHHTIPFSMSRSNDPTLLKPLCRAHHDILHSVNFAYLERKFGR